MIPESIVGSARSAGATGRSPMRRGTTTSPDSSAGYESLGKCACGGSCPRCRDKSPTKTELVISEPDDAYEREADQVANIVMQMSPSEVGEVTSGRGRRLGQRRLAREHAGVDEAPRISHDVLPTQGKPLDAETRGFFEPRFDRDLRNVRIHSGATAEKSTRNLGARAYTLGHNIVFAPGQFDSRSNTGKWLLAHELAHVVSNEAVGRSSTRPTIQRKVAPGSVDCEDDPPRRIKTDTPMEDLIAADNDAVSLLNVAVEELRELKAGEADGSLQLEAYRYLNRYFGEFKDNEGAVTIDFIKEAMNLFTTTLTIESMIMRLNDLILPLIESGDLRYECLAKHCNRDTHAWSQFGDPTIHLCKSFWRADNRSRALTIIHEAYHILVEDSTDTGVSRLNSHCMAGFVGSLNGTHIGPSGKCRD